MVNDADNSFSPGTMLGKYELLATIGKGGMARVLLARHRGIGGFERPVVIKVIHPHLANDTAAINMLVDEARLASLIVHHNVVQTYELDEAHGTFYIVMEYLAGESLSQVIRRAARRNIPLPPHYAAQLVSSVCEGLHAAHEVVIHRDISPGNLVVLYSGAVKIVDFGIAKGHGRITDTATGELKGKFGYMPPEQIKNEPMDRRSDLFSLGVVLWEALTHRRLFQAESVGATLLQILNAARVPPSELVPGIPPELDAIVLKALSIDPRERFQTAAEMKTALDDIAWSSRCGTAEVSAYMTGMFADRIEQRRALLARTRHDDPRIREILAALEDEADLAHEAATEPRSDRHAAANVPARPSITMREPTEVVLLDRVAPPRKSSRLEVWLLAASVVIAGLAAAAVVGFHDSGDALEPETEVVAAAERGPRMALDIDAGASATAVVTPIDPVSAASTAATGSTPTASASDTVAPGTDRTVADDARTRPRPSRGTPRGAPRKVVRENEDEDEDEAPANEEPPAPAPAVANKPVTSPTDTTLTPTTATPAAASSAALDALYRKATAFHLAGQFGDAAATFDQMIALDPRHAAAYRGLGMATQRMGHDARAIAAYRTYLTLRPNARDTDTIRARLAALESP